MGAHGLLQGHATVRGAPCVAPEGGFDFGTVFRHHRCACWSTATMRPELSRTSKTRAEIVHARSCSNAPLSGRRGVCAAGTNVRLVSTVHNAERTNFGEGLDTTMSRRPRRGQPLRGPGACRLRDVMEEDRAVKKCPRTGASPRGHETSRGDRLTREATLLRGVHPANVPPSTTNARERRAAAIREAASPRAARAPPR